MPRAAPNLKVADPLDEPARPDLEWYPLLLVIPRGATLGHVRDQHLSQQPIRSV